MGILSKFGAGLTGRYGERLTEMVLYSLKRSGKNGIVLHNIYVPKDNGETTEIDVAFITQKGIFVIESKNYSGWIFGNEQNMYWTASLPNGEKNQFYNPVWQNRTHIKYLKNFLADNIPMFSLIVFSERCELKKITVTSPETYVIQRNELYSYINFIWGHHPDGLDPQTVDNIYTKLNLQTATNNRALKHEHVRAINQKLIQPNDSLVCPFCGSRLVLRTAKKGANAGNQFYGCSNFPKCRYIKNS